MVIFSELPVSAFQTEIQLFYQNQRSCRGRNGMTDQLVIRCYLVTFLSDSLNTQNSELNEWSLWHADWAYLPRHSHRYGLNLPLVQFVEPEEIKWRIMEINASTWEMPFKNQCRCELMKTSYSTINMKENDF